MHSEKSVNASYYLSTPNSKVALRKNIQLVPCHPFNSLKDCYINTKQNGIFFSLETIRSSAGPFVLHHPGGYISGFESPSTLWLGYSCCGVLFFLLGNVKAELSPLYSNEVVCSHRMEQSPLGKLSENWFSELSMTRIQTVRPWEYQCLWLDKMPTKALNNRSKARQLFFVARAYWRKYFSSAYC